MAPPAQRVFRGVLLLQLVKGSASVQQVVRFESPVAGITALRREGYDVWAARPTSKNQSGVLDVDVLVDGAVSDAMTIAGVAAGATAKVVLADVTASVEAERRHVRVARDLSQNWTRRTNPIRHYMPFLFIPPRSAQARRGDDSFFDTFRPYEDHLRFQAQLAEECPDTVELLPAIGRTFEGREIFAVRLHAPKSRKGKPVVYLQSTAHAREWLATTSLAWSMKTIAEGYKTNTTIARMLDAFDFLVVPILNVDGYIFTWEENRLWRKNRRNNGNGVYGVDINRNWGPKATWCTTGSSTSPSADTYCGLYTFSEPETAAAASLCDMNNVVAAADFHTYGSLLLYPWQYTHEKVSQPDLLDFEVAGLAMQIAVNAQFDGEYKTIQGSDLYPHSGGMIDYLYETQDTWAFTLEGRGEGFIVPDSDIVPAGVEQFEAIVVMTFAAAGTKL